MKHVGGKLNDSLMSFMPIFLAPFYLPKSFLEVGILELASEIYIFIL